MQLACSYAAKYKATKAPTCGCLACAMLWKHRQILNLVNPPMQELTSNDMEIYAFILECYIDTPIKFSFLAELMNVPRSSIARSLRKLVAANFIERHPSKRGGYTPVKPVDPPSITSNGGEKVSNGTDKSQKVA